MHLKRLAIVSLTLVLGLVAAGCAQKSGPGGGKEQTGTAQQQQEATAPGGADQGGKDADMDIAGKDGGMDMSGKDGNMDMGGMDMGSGGEMAGHNVKEYDVPADAPKVQVVMKDLRFEPAEVNLKAGQPVRFAVENQGQAQHDFMVTGDNGFDTGVLKPGEKKEIGWIPEKPGTYEAFCSQPGHKEAGMTAKLVVE